VPLILVLFEQKDFHELVHCVLLVDPVLPYSHIIECLEPCWQVRNLEVQTGVVEHMQVLLLVDLDIEVFSILSADVQFTRLHENISADCNIDQGDYDQQSR
jgi:hypothetical protein